MSGPEQDRGRFAERLRWLRDTIHPADRGPYTPTEIADAIADHPGASSRVFVSNLLEGKQKNPRMHHIEALASFFGVKPEFFFDDAAAEDTRRQVEEVIAWRDTEAGELAQRLNSLSPEGRNTISTMIDNLAAYEHQGPSGRRRNRSAGDDT